ncbi:MAG: DUF2786 domain-containing protein [Acidimicrobiales bacterium]
MGKNNRARRAAKAKAKERGYRRSGPDGGPRGRSSSARGSYPGGDQPDFTDAERVGMLWAALSMAAMNKEPVTSFLHRLRAAPPHLVDREWEDVIRLHVREAWAGGWQPAELVRQAGRATSGRVPSRLVEAAVAADHLDYPDQALDPRWRSQIAALGLPPVSASSGWSGAILADVDDRMDQLDAMTQAVACLAVPRLDVLIPPPGADPGATWPRGGRPVASNDAPDPIIAKVRNLLAKAESTEFDAEAIAFTAKAHELMTRHAIDMAALAGRGQGRRERPVAARVFVDAPYADGKSLLLQIIAQETRCRCAFHTGLDMSTVVGFSDDVAAVQLLFTSLLVQAQIALNTAARSAPPGTRTRSQAFRSAFYLAYAQRIGERLSEANQETTDAATEELGESFLPVLADRAREVDEVFDERFRTLTSGRVRGGYDQAGWASGTRAGNEAQLGLSDPGGVALPAG